MKKLIMIIIFLIVGMSIPVFADTSIEERVSQNTAWIIRNSEALVSDSNKSSEIQKALLAKSKSDRIYRKKINSLQQKQMDLLLNAILALDKRLKLIEVGE